MEQAHQIGEKMELAVWNEDEAGPYQTKPYPGSSWEPEGEPKRQPHEYVRDGTAKLLTLFHPASGEVRVKGVTSSANASLHPWLKEELSDILTKLAIPKRTGCGNQSKALGNVARRVIHANYLTGNPPSSADALDLG